jgi:hypothetical protein
VNQVITCQCCFTLVLDPYFREHSVWHAQAEEAGHRCDNCTKNMPLHKRGRWTRTYTEHGKGYSFYYCTRDCMREDTPEDATA